MATSVFSEEQVVTVNDQTLTVRALSSGEIARLDIRPSLFLTNIDAAVLVECRQRWGGGTLVKLEEGRYRWELTEAKTNGD